MLFTFEIVNKNIIKSDIIKTQAAKPFMAVSKKILHSIKEDDTNNIINIICTRSFFLKYIRKLIIIKLSNISANKKYRKFEKRITKIFKSGKDRANNTILANMLNNET